MTPTPHQPDSSIDIEALRKAAEAALHTGEWYNAGCGTVQDGEHDEVAHPCDPSAVAHIVAAQPRAVIALLDRLERETATANEWRGLFFRVAGILNCLPSTYTDANDHVLKAAERRAEAAAGAVPLVVPDFDGSPCAQCGDAGVHICEKSARGAAPSEPVAWHPALKAAADVVMALPLREGFDNDACKAMAITANAAILNLATPPAQDAGTGDAEEVAEAVAREVIDHIDTMYPAMWSAVAKTARTSIRNTIINQSGRFIRAIANSGRAE